MVHERYELADLGVDVSLSSIMRNSFEPPQERRIDAFARAAVAVARSEPGVISAPAAPKAAARTTRAVSQSQVRALLRKKTAERRGLGVERAQVSRFKAGKEQFPAAKLAGLFDVLSSDE